MSLDIARKYTKCLEELRFKQYWKPFLWFSSFCQESYPELQLSIAKYHQTWPWTFQSGRQIWLLHDLLEELDSSCRNSLIINVDTSKQPWLLLGWCPFIRWRIEIETRDNVKVGFVSWFGLRDKFPRTDPCPTLSIENFLWCFCYVFFDSIHGANPRNCSVSK